MDISLPGNRGLFSHMQEALRQVEGKRLALTRGFHQALTDFRWLAEYLIRFPTRLYELVPFQPKTDGYHNASGYIFGGGSTPGTHLGDPDPPTSAQCCGHIPVSCGSAPHHMEVPFSWYPGVTQKLRSPTVT